MPLTRRRARASAGLQRIEGARALDEVRSRGLSRLLKSSLLLFLERQTLGAKEWWRHGRPSVDAGPDGRSAVHAAASRDRPRRAHRLGRRSRGIRRATPALRDGARALRGGIRDGATPHALRPHAGGAERRYARDARGSEHAAPPDGRRRRPAAIRGSRGAPRGRIRRRLVHRGHRDARADPDRRVHRRLPDRRHHRHDRDIVHARARQTLRWPTPHQPRLRSRARRLRLRARLARQSPRGDASITRPRRLQAAAAARARGEPHEARRTRQRCHPRVDVHGDDVRDDAPRTRGGRHRGTGDEAPDGS